MVHAGQNSSACEPCRRRRVKCDGRKPACQRCKTRGLVCTGYPDPNAIKFVFQFAPSDTENSPSPPSSSSSPHSASKVANSHVKDHSGSPLVLSSLPGSMSTDWEYQSTQYFFHSFIMQKSSDGNPGYLDFARSMYASAGPKSCVHLSIKAAALAAMANRTSIQSLRTKAENYYGRALKAINTSLNNEKEAKKDETAVAVLIIVLFEAIYYDFTLALGHHADGLKALAEIRGPEQFLSENGRRIWTIFIPHLQLRRFAKRKIPTPLEDEWMKKFEGANPRERLLLDGHQVAHLCGRASLLLQENNMDFDLMNRIDNWLTEAIELDKKLSTSLVVPDKEWACRRVDQLTREDNPTENGSGVSFVLLYANFFFGFAWNFHRMIRLTLNEVLMEMQEKLIALSGKTDDLSQARIVQYQDTIGKLLDEMIASIPFMSGDVDTNGDLQINPPPGIGYSVYSFISPLTRVVVSPYATFAHLKVALTTSERMARNVGVRYAITAARVARMRLESKGDAVWQAAIHPSLRIPPVPDVSLEMGVSSPDLMLPFEQDSW